MELLLFCFFPPYRSVQLHRPCVNCLLEQWIISQEPSFWWRYLIFMGPFQDMQQTMYPFLSYFSSRTSWQSIIPQKWMNFCLSTTLCSWSFLSDPQIAPLTSPNIIPNKAPPRGSELSPGLSLCSLTAAPEQAVRNNRSTAKTKEANFHHRWPSWHWPTDAECTRPRTVTGGTCPSVHGGEDRGCTLPAQPLLSTRGGSELACSAWSLFSYHQGRRAKL